MPKPIPKDPTKPYPAPNMKGVIIMAKKATSKPTMKEVGKKPEMGKMPNKMEMMMMGKMAKKGMGKKGMGC